MLQYNNQINIKKLMHDGGLYGNSTILGLLEMFLVAVS